MIIVIQCLRKPETLHEVRLVGILVPNIVDDCVAEFGAGEFLDAGEHAPDGILEGFVACYAVHDEDGFDSFGSVLSSLLIALEERDGWHKQRPC